MAVTSIHPIKVTDEKAIVYIVNDEKTANGALTEYYASGENPGQASNMFASTRKLGSGRGTILAQHVFQSFAPGEVTQAQAFEIGKRLADEVLKGEYQYVLATHIDKQHIHNHLIFCNTNMVNFRTYETNENKGRYSFKTIRDISDNLCKEHMLSVIEQSENSEKGTGYFENIQGLNGNSWKSKIKIIINALVFQSENFEDFLRKCQTAGIEIFYKPQNKIRLKYRLPGMEKWARAKTLGPPYDVEGITSRIEKYKAFFNGENIKAPRINLINTDNEYFQNHEYLKLWAKLKNVKTIAELMLVAESKGCRNIADIADKIKLTHTERQSLIAERNDIKKQIAEFELLSKAVADYKKFKPFKTERDRLKGEIFGAKKSQEYSKQHSEELRKFNVALEALNGYQFENNKLPDYELLLENIARLKNTLMEKDNAVKNSVDQIGKLTAIKKAFEEYLQIKNPEKEVEERNQRSDERASGQQRYDERA